MYYFEPIREAARRADAATWEATQAYGDETLPHEPHITSGLALLLRNALQGSIQGLQWSSHVMRSASGSGAEESVTGADLIIHVRFTTPELTYSKGVLIQAKRVEPGRRMSREQHAELVGQCSDMLNITAASFVFNYTKVGMRCGSASAIVTSNNRNLHEQCVWTPYRFFFELFRCPIGDPKITSTKVDALPTPNKLHLSASRGGERTRR